MQSAIVVDIDQRTKMLPKKYVQISGVSNQAGTARSTVAACNNNNQCCEQLEESLVNQNLELLNTTTTTTTTTFNGLFSKPVCHKGKTSLNLNEAKDDGVLGCNGISWTICKRSAPPPDRQPHQHGHPITQFVHAGCSA